MLLKSEYFFWKFFKAKFYWCLVISNGDLNNEKNNIITEIDVVTMLYITFKKINWYYSWFLPDFSSFALKWVNVTFKGTSALDNSSALILQYTAWYGILLKEWNFYALLTDAILFVCEARIYRRFQAVQRGASNWDCAFDWGLVIFIWMLLTGEIIHHHHPVLLLSCHFHGR